ncbi:MoxR family ATPase [Chloroflexi bacterium TSY]|nr:MoxR family ATPase [Chloroflexi bacterium TSY]
MIDIAPIQQIARSVRDNVANVIVGKDDVIELLLVSLFCEGHVLLEDVPGTGKTMLARTLARSLGCSFQRIQFTPDLLPSDITGVNVFNQQTNLFDYRAGPIMAQVVLADEINRAGPRTQSALLEAMAERQVTVDGTTRQLPYPFLVLATQNPVELDGTFPLPEAQVDRFLMRLSLGYPEREEEREILHRFRTADPLSSIEPVISVEQIEAANQLCCQVYMHPILEDYLLDLIQATREDSALSLGASPRGSLALYRTSQALAAIRNRNYVIPDDIKLVSGPVLAHRLIPHVETRLHAQSVEEILAKVLKQTPVPVEENWESEFWKEPSKSL